jgi:hypothetical protein
MEGIKQMKVIIRGKNKTVNLEQNDFLAEGGEGKVYEKDGLVYKIYTDKTKVIKYEKIQELSVLNLKNVVRPLDFLLDSKNTPIGFTMESIKNTIPICKLFTNEFRKNNGVQDTSIQKLVDKMQDIIYFIHEKNILLVDGNEMNYLVSKIGFDNPFFIDVDSYQTKSFPATVIMPSIRDWQTKGFNNLTDWYSFAIVSCQLFIGIHPFKGKHQVKGLEERMRKNISIFDKDVHLPPTVRDFGHIPSQYMTWYKKLFEKGERIPPPMSSGLMNVVPVKVKIVQSTNNFEISFIKEFPDEIVDIKSMYGTLYVKTIKEIFIGNTGYKIINPKTDIILAQGSLNPILFNTRDNNLYLLDLVNKKSEILSISNSDRLLINNTLYIVNEGNLSELNVHYFNKIVVSIKSVWKIMPKSSILLDGLVYQNVLGKAFLTIPVPEESLSLSSCYEFRFPELDGYKIISGKHESKICMIVGFKNGKYYKFTIKFSDNYSTYQIIETKEVDLGNNLNFTVLSNGICVSIDEDEEVNVFFNSSKSNVTKIKDPDIDSSMTLCKDGTKVMFYRGRSLYSLTMKKK